MKEKYEELKQMVEKGIDDFLKNYEFRNEVKDIVKGGKRLRGVLCLLSCESFGGQPEDALDAAVAVELIHSASLTHDDILDLDEIRRGDLAYWLKKGVAAAIIVPHMVVSHALSMISKYGFKAVQIAIKTWETVTKGEVLDVFKKNWLCNPYVMIAKAKTGALFSISVVLGAIAAGKNDYETLSKCDHYGKALGLAYQIADDYIDTINLKLEPSIPLFLHYIGFIEDWKLNLKDLKTSENLVQKIFNAAAMINSLAMKKLEEAIKQAEEEAPNEQLRQFVRFAVDMMLKKG